MITIEFWDWPQSDQVVKYAADRHLNISEAIEELVNKALGQDPPP